MVQEPTADSSPAPYQVVYDSQGFRNLTHMDSADVAMVGDSFLETSRDDELMPVLLARRERLRVVNLGQLFYGLRQELVVGMLPSVSRSPHFSRVPAVTIGDIVGIFPVRSLRPRGEPPRLPSHLTPSPVLVQKGHAHLIRRRGTYSDMHANLEGSIGPMKSHRASPGG